MRSPLLGAGDVKALLAESGVRPSRRRGQNFLADPNLVRRIVRLAGVGPGDEVLEVGIGVGSLTAGLVEAGAHVVGIEIEAAFCDTVRGLLPAGSVATIEGDAADFDWLELKGGGFSPTYFVSNLPYSVGTTVLLDVLSELPSVRSGVVMVQREVAERLCASPGSRTYGATTVKVDSLAEVRYLGAVPRDVFVPEPEVTSALVGFTRRRDGHGAATTAGLWEVVDAAFAHRRKTLRNSLVSAWPATAVDAALAGAGLDGTRRGESLSTEEFRVLAEMLAASVDVDEGPDRG